METCAPELKTLQTQQNQEEPYSKIATLSSNNEEKAPFNNDKHIVLYDPNQNQSTPIIHDPQCNSEDSNLGPERVLPSVGAFTVQCAMCYKWRFIPTKKKYEEIREHILLKPFTCYVAKEWRNEVSCETQGDIEQDESRLWAIDKPSIAQTPLGWERELRIRGQGCKNFADVYYISPSGKRLRSIVEVEKYLVKHPEFVAQGVTLSQFSFKIPRPLHKNNVTKRTPQLTMTGDSNIEVPRPLQTFEANPLSWVAPDNSTTLQLVQANDNSPPAKRKARPSTSTTLLNPPQNGRLEMGFEEGSIIN